MRIPQLQLVLCKCIQLTLTLIYLFCVVYTLNVTQFGQYYQPIASLSMVIYNQVMSFHNSHMQLLSYTESNQVYYLVTYIHIQSNVYCSVSKLDKDKILVSSFLRYIELTTLKLRFYIAVYNYTHKLLFVNQVPLFSFSVLV